MIAPRLQELIGAVGVADGARIRLGEAPWIDLARDGHPPSAAHLLKNLTGHLYNHAHASSWPGPCRVWVGAPPPADEAYLTRLTAGRQTPLASPGWQRVHQEPSGAATFTLGAWQRRARAGTWWPDPRAGHHLLQVPSPHPGPWGTFVFLYGKTLGSDVSEERLLRIYLHTQPPAPEQVIRAVADTLDRHLIPFVLKTLMAPRSADRTDATVLYLHRRYHRVALRALCRLGALLRQLGPGTPLCALPLQPGVAVAEDNRSAESFGMQRMRLIAEGVLESVCSEDDSLGARIDRVSARFAAAGLRLSAPHLAPRSRQDYRADWPA